MTDILFKIVLSMLIITSFGMMIFGVAVWWIVPTMAFLMKLCLSWIMILAGAVFCAMSLYAWIEW